jgi:probable phosphoglycerate mutase
VRPHFERRPLLVSSKGVGRVIHRLLGGQERMQVGNGEIVEFAVAPAAGQLDLRVSRPHQA